MNDDYLNLLEKCLINTIYEDPPVGPGYKTEFHLETRLEGMDWPSKAHTMIGLKRLKQLRKAVETVLSEDIPGDLMETGVWRGGACIMMRAVIKAFDDPPNRRVIVADSFEGLPFPDAEKYPADKGDRHHQYENLQVSEKVVANHFSKYDLLDERVIFLKGWFRDTLPTAPVKQLAVLRLDGDMYESTMVALESLYDNVAVGGFIIIDDFGVVPGCKSALHDFRNQRGISTPYNRIDKTGVFWRKTEAEAKNSFFAKYNFRVAGYYPACDSNLDSADSTQTSKEPKVLRNANLGNNARTKSAPTLEKSDQSLSEKLQMAADAKTCGEHELAKKLLLEILSRNTDTADASQLLAELTFPGPTYREVLYQLHKSLQPKMYLEIGVDRGATLKLATDNSVVIGIDPAPHPPRKLPTNATIYHTTSDAFFKSNLLQTKYQSQPIDLAFIDGDHRFEQVLKDFLNVETHCHSDSVILLHDCLPMDEATSSPVRTTSFYTGDCWKVVPCLQMFRPELEIHTIPTAPSGLTVISKVNPFAKISSAKFDEMVREFKDLSYHDFEQLLQSSTNMVINTKEAVGELFSSLNWDRQRLAA